MTGAAGRGPWPARGALALLGLALMLPVLLAPTPLNDSHAINLVWSHQFTTLVARGEPWPRWLPWSHDGLGAPVFFFYGPVAFWGAAAFGLAGLATWPAIAAAATAFLGASGLGMHALLRARGAPRPLAGAAFYMAAPFHLLDFARRGAFAEFAAAALLPFVALGLRRAAAGRPLPGAIAYALLIMAHLPLTLLATVLLLPMLALERPDRTALRRIAGALALGIGLAAAYLVPALALQRFTSMDTMHGTGTLLQPANWTIAVFWQDRNPALLLLLAIGTALAVAALALAPARGADRRWTWFVLLIVALSLGLLAPLWRLPALDRVQFPWRALCLAEFGLAIAIGQSRCDGARVLIAAAPALILSGLVLAPSLAAIGEPESPRRATLLRLHPDVPEYLPRGTERSSATFSARALALARTVPPARREGGAVTLRRTAFPIWQQACADGRHPTGVTPGGLIRIRAGCRLVRTAPVAQRLGLILSLASLAVLALVGMAAPPGVDGSTEPVRS